MTRARTTVLLLILALLLAACGGGGDDEGDVDAGAGETTTSTEAGPVEPSTTTAAPSTTEAEEAGPVYPLTGLPAGENAARPALAIKIDNHPKARPQVGINEADLVFEEVVEGNITRFVGVFHSQDADPIGPVRSARTSDIQILGAFERILFANSGGNFGTLARVDEAPYLVNANVNALPSLYYRERSRVGPHNLFSNTSALIDSIPDVAPPNPIFTFGDDLDGGRPVSRVDIDYGGTQVSFEWDAGLEGWARTENGTPAADADDDRIAPTNLVILETEYGRSPADAGSPEAIVTGTGTAHVLTDGTRREGTWTRPEPTAVPELTAADGSPLALRPGTVWVAMPRPQHVAFTD